MLYNFLISLVDQFSALNVFRYLTFRTGLSLMSSMIIVFLIGGPFIKFIESRKITGPIRDDGPIGHIVKKVGTPTMGGVLILIGIIFGTFFKSTDFAHFSILNPKPPNRDFPLKFSFCKMVCCFCILFASMSWGESKKNLLSLCD